jgi:superfamily I DNA/RNA helicase
MNYFEKGLDPTHGGKLHPVFITNKNGVRQLVYKLPEEIDALQHKHLAVNDIFYDKKGLKLTLKKVVGFKQDKNSAGYLLKLEDENKKEIMRYVHNLDIEETLNAKNKSFFENNERAEALVNTEKTYQNTQNADLIVKPIEVKDDLVTSVSVDKNTNLITEKTTNVTDFIQQNKSTEVQKEEPMKQQAQIELKRQESGKRIWSPYQNATFDFALNGTGNAVINAVAGSGKTTTIVEIIKRLPSTVSAIFLAFNKSIADELGKKMPKNATSSTLHSFGLACIRAKYPKVKIDNNKLLFHTEEVVTANNFFEKSEAFEKVKKKPLFEQDDAEFKYKTGIKKLVNLARQNLVSSPEGLIELGIKHGVFDDDSEADNLPEATISVLKSMYKDRGRIDFEDMIFYPACDPDLKPKGSEFVFVDECQDLNKAQQQMLKRMLYNVPNSRFIAVGDPSQAIYGFRGSDENSFRNLQNMPNTITLPLTVTYRCGKNIVNFAKEQTGVTHLEAFEGNSDGEVNMNVKIDELKEGDMVLSRKNAPAIAFCFNLLANGKKAFLVGRSIGEEIANYIEKSSGGKKNLFNETGKEILMQKMQSELDDIRKKLEKKGLQGDEVTKNSAYTTKADKFDCVKLFLDKHKTPAEAVTDIRKIFSDETKQGISVSSAHKSKGLEADNVYIIDIDNMPMRYPKQKEWEKIQENNLCYVAYTRAKNRLGFIQNEQWKGDDEDRTSFGKGFVYGEDKKAEEEVNLKELFEN